MNATNTASQIKIAHAECALLNPHFSDEQARDWVFQVVFGAYKGAEEDKRNLALC